MGRAAGCGYAFGSTRCLGGAMTRIVNKWAIGLTTEALNWARSATLLEVAFPKQAHFCVGRSLEQSLKAVLVDAGASESKILDLGHDLVKSWDWVKDRTDASPHLNQAMQFFEPSLADLSNTGSWAYGSDQSEGIIRPVGWGSNAERVAKCAANVLRAGRKTT